MLHLQRDRISDPGCYISNATGSAIPDASSETRQDRRPLWRSLRGEGRGKVNSINDDAIMMVNGGGTGSEMAMCPCAAERDAVEQLAAALGHGAVSPPHNGPS